MNVRSLLKQKNKKKKGAFFRFGLHFLFDHILNWKIFPKQLPSIACKIQNIDI